MPVRTIVISSQETAPTEETHDYDINETLRGEAGAAVEISEILDNVLDSIAGKLREPAELTIEIGAGAELSASGGVKWLVLNIGAGAKSSETVKISVKTKVHPPKG